MSDITYNDVAEINESRAAQLEIAGPDFTVSAVLSRTWTVLLKNPIVFFGLTALLLVLIRFAIVGMVRQWPEFAMKYRVPIVLTVSMIFGQWIGGAMVYGVYQSLKGGRASLLDSLLCGTRRIVPLLFVGTLVEVATALGYLLFVIPGIILNCMWLAAVPVCVVERLGATDSLLRSEKLTKDCRLKIYGLLLLTEIFTYILGKIVSSIMGVDDAMVFFELIPSLVANLIPMAFGYVMTAVVYYSLRETKEGVSVDLLANVFD